MSPLYQAAKSQRNSRLAAHQASLVEKNSATEFNTTGSGSACGEYLPERTTGVQLNPVSHIQFGLFSFFLGFLVCFLHLATVVQGGETNLLATRAETAVHHSLPKPQEVAAELEQAGRKPEATALYEELAKTNSSARKVLSHRLVTLYTETGETNRALMWAREVMRDNPDPQAYLAGVHARLGQCQEARKILEREIAGNTNSIRAVTLRWQLAEVCAQQGDKDKARSVLNQAVGMAKGTAMEATTQQRLKALNGRTK